MSSPQVWLAGNPGPPPSAASVILTLTVLLLAFGAAMVITRPRWHFGTPLRRPVQAQPAVTFRAPVRVKADFLSVTLPVHGSLELTIRGDAFQIDRGFALSRRLFGQGWSYQASDVTIEMVPGLLHYWIEINGPSLGRIQIGNRDRNRQIWYALLGAGARPIGPPPPNGTTSGRAIP